MMPTNKLKLIINENKKNYIINNKKIRLNKLQYLKSYKLIKKFKFKLKKYFKNAKEIIYTSGTTGSPKGVILSLDKSEIVAKMINKIVSYKVKQKSLSHYPSIIQMDLEDLNVLQLMDTH